MIDQTEERFVENAGVRIWAEALGDPAHPAVLLVAGADSSSLRWGEPIVRRFLDSGHRVIRYDHRDTGLSDLLPADQAYTLDDLVADALAVLDGFGIETAHVVGHSMGGMVAQLLALDRPDRVLTLTLLCTSPAPGDERLPPPTDDLIEAVALHRFAPLPQGDDERAGWLLDLSRAFTGSRYPFDEDYERAVATAEVRRSWRPETGHGPAVHSSPGWFHRLGAVEHPTLVVHGTDDPVYPEEHARALASRIPGARLVLVDGLGHETPPALFEDIWPTLDSHLRR